MSLRRTVKLTQHRGNRLQTAPAAEPVSAAELRTHLRESETTLPDAQANGFITQARQWIEDQIALALIDQVWLLTIDRWPGGSSAWWDGTVQAHINVLHGDGHLVDVEIPRWPLQSVDTVNVYDEDGNATAVTIADVFDVDVNSIPGRMTLQKGAVWPVALRSNNAIEITYTSGYGAAGTDAPAPLVAAVKNLAAALYTNRGDGCEMNAVNSGVKAFLSTYKVKRI